MKDRAIRAKTGCQCILTNILADKEVQFIKSLFETTDKKGPNGQRIGVIDVDKSKGQYFGCPYMYNWGFDFFCDNQTYLEKYKLV